MYIHGKLYNLEGFDHPGGLEILKLCDNEPDSSALFESYHAFCDMEKIKRIMKKYEIKETKPKKSLFRFDNNGFYSICQKRVKNYIKKNVKATTHWFITVFFSWALFIYCQYQLLFGLNIILKVVGSLLSGLSLVFLGYNILHDGSHYAISNYPIVNNYCSKLIQSLLLWNHTLWTYHHCIRHHQYTGMIEYDPDLINSNPFLRKSELIKPKPMEFSKKNINYKLLFLNILLPGTLFGQALLYHLAWVRKGYLWKMCLPKDFGKMDDIIQYILSGLFVFIELYYGGFFYFYLHIVGANIGYFIGSSPDHDMYDTHKQVSKNNNIDMDWGELQVRHSGNFFNKDTIPQRSFTRFMGGINYQIEHHLFPTLSNHQLPEIAPIVKQTCKEFDIPYVCINSPGKVFREVCKTYEEVHNN